MYTRKWQDISVVNPFRVSGLGIPIDVYISCEVDGWDKQREAEVRGGEAYLEAIGFRGEDEDFLHHHQFLNEYEGSEFGNFGDGSFRILPSPQFGQDNRN